MHSYFGSSGSGFRVFQRISGKPDEQVGAFRLRRYGPSLNQTDILARLHACMHSHLPNLPHSSGDRVHERPRELKPAIIGGSEGVGTMHGKQHSDVSLSMLCSSTCC